MAKGKKTSSGGPRKSHGPKKHLFKWYKPMIKSMADTGILSKYYDFDSFCLACVARGKRNPTKSDFNEFFILPIEEKKNYFNNIKRR